MHMLNINFLPCNKIEWHNLNMFQRGNIAAPILENNNLSYTSHNHSSVTILKHFVCRWQMNKTAEFLLPRMIHS